MSHLIFPIQIVLFVGSGSLLAAGLTAMYRRGAGIRRHSVLQHFSNKRHATRQDHARTENRRASRLPSYATLEILDDFGHLTGAARMHNLSLTGARFDIPLALKVGKKFQARLHASNKSVRKIIARVVWAKPKRRSILYGVEFQTTHPSSS